jgi:hypothetical protein
VSTSVVEIDPATNHVSRTVDLGAGTGDPILIDGTLWFPVVDHADAAGNGVPGTLDEIDPATGAIRRTVSVDGSFQAAGAVVDGDRVWIADQAYPGRLLELSATAISGG